MRDFLEVHLKSYKWWLPDSLVDEWKRDKEVIGVGFWIALVVSFPFWLLLLEPIQWVYETGLHEAVKLGLGRM